jgi:DNA polymerase
VSAQPVETVSSAAGSRREQLEALAEAWSACADCRLAEGRTTVVVGDGNPDADLMFVGEAPGFHEDRRGLPFVGAAGQLLDELLAGIGLTRADCYIANVLKCRPPGNRDPLDDEIAACQEKLLRQIDLIQPRVICTLGNFATRLLSGKPFGVTRVHGHARRAGSGPLAGREVVLYPLYHPAAALYNASLRPVLEADVARLPELLRHLAENREALQPPPSREAQPVPLPVAAPAPAGAPDGEQLGLF